MKDAEKKIEGLREKIRQHEHLYNVLDNPGISDAEFDKLMGSAWLDSRGGCAYVVSL
jgi:NAD-dependent DNA ligase